MCFFGNNAHSGMSIWLNQVYLLSAYYLRSVPLEGTGNREPTDMAARRGKEAPLGYIAQGV